MTQNVNGQSLAMQKVAQGRTADLFKNPVYFRANAPALGLMGQKPNPRTDAARCPAGPLMIMSRADWGRAMQKVRSVSHGDAFGHDFAMLDGERV